jgi:hypothetical protein
MEEDEAPFELSWSRIWAVRAELLCRMWERLGPSRDGAMLYGLIESYGAGVWVDDTGTG